MSHFVALYLLPSNLMFGFDTSLSDKSFNFGEYSADLGFGVHPSQHELVLGVAPWICRVYGVGKLRWILNSGQRILCSSITPYVVDGPTSRTPGYREWGPHVDAVPRIV